MQTVPFSVNHNAVEFYGKIASALEACHRDRRLYRKWDMGMHSDWHVWT